MGKCGQYHRVNDKGCPGVPAEYRIYVMVPVGYPAYDPQNTTRRDIKDIIHYDGFSPEKYRTDDQILEFIKGLRKRYRF